MQTVVQYVYFYLLVCNPLICLQLISPDFEGKTKLTERWYGTEYNQLALTKATEKWGTVTYKDFPVHLPAPNELIPSK